MLSGINMQSRIARRLGCGLQLTPVLVTGLDVVSQMGIQ